VHLEYLGKTAFFRKCKPMKQTVFENENGARRVNWCGLSIFWVIAALLAFAAWAGAAVLLTGDWAWKWPLGIIHSIGGPAIMLGAMSRLPIERLPRRI
jgi:hypothetical protein